jgi:pyrophosphatase PpaX
MTGAALFDWDGTLLDSREALLRAWHAATERVVGRRYPATAAEEDLVFTLPGSELFGRVAGDAERAARLTAEFQRCYEGTGELVRAFPGVVELLGELRDAGARVAVITSKARRRYELDARRIGVWDLVDVAVCQEDTTRHKPDPAPVLHALRALDAAPQEAAMAGDTPVEVAAGAAAGVHVLGVAWGAAGEQPLLAAGAAAVARDAGELGRLMLAAVTSAEGVAT